MKAHIPTIIASAAAALLFCALAMLATDALTRPAPTVARSDAAAPLSRVVVHFDPAAADTVEPTYRQIFDALPDAEVLVAVHTDADFDAFAERFGVSGDARWVPVVVGRPITTWSRDRYTLAHRGEAPVLLIPPQRDKLAEARANDWLVPVRLARTQGADLQMLDFDFDGGDIIVGPDAAYADVNLIRKNPDRFRTPAAVADALRGHLGRPVVVLGDEPGDVPHHHIGMYLTPLPSGAVAVGSPTLALDLLGGPDSDATRALAKRLQGAGLPPLDLTPEATARFDRPARQLQAAGTRVVRLPLLPLADQVTFITYNNGLTHHPASPDAPPHFLMPAYDLPTLDAEATRILQKEGLRVTPIDVRRVFRHHGSVRCLVNVL